MALSKLAMELLGIRSMAAEWKIVKEGVTCQLYTDASAALSIAKRQGAGNNLAHQCEDPLAAREGVAKGGAPAAREGVAA